MSDIGEIQNGPDHSSVVSKNQNGSDHLPNVGENQDGPDHSSDVTKDQNGLDHSSVVSENQSGSDHLPNVGENQDGPDHSSDVTENKNSPDNSSYVGESQNVPDHQTTENLVFEVSKEESDTISNTQVVKSVANQNVLNGKIQLQSEELPTATTEMRWSSDVRTGSMTPSVIIEEVANELRPSLVRNSKKKLEQNYGIEPAQLPVNKRYSKPDAEQDCIIRTSGGILATADCVVKFPEKSFGRTVEVKLSCCFPEKVGWVQYI